MTHTKQYRYTCKRNAVFRNERPRLAVAVLCRGVSQCRELGTVYPRARVRGVLGSTPLGVLLHPLVVLLLLILQQLPFMDRAIAIRKLGRD